MQAINMANIPLVFIYHWLTVTCWRSIPVQRATWLVTISNFNVTRWIVFAMSTSIGAINSIISRFTAWNVIIYLISHTFAYFFLLGEGQYFLHLHYIWSIYLRTVCKIICKNHNLIYNCYCKIAKAEHSLILKTINQGDFF